MRAMSWYQNQQCDHRKDTQGHCVFDCEPQIKEQNMKHDCSGCGRDCLITGGPDCANTRNRPQQELPCVSFVPARAAYHQIKTGVLIPPDRSPDVIDGVFITDVHPKFVRLGVGHENGQMSYAGRWDKGTLKAFGEALLKLSEYMEG